MDELHLPPDIYQDLRDQSNFRILRWLCTIVELRRCKWAKSPLQSPSADQTHQARAERSDKDPG
jgi:hypothetical protein